MKKPHLPILVAVLLARAVSADAAELEGRVTLAKDGETRAGEETLVYFTPERPATLTVPAEPFEIVTAGKEFQPRALVVPVGSTVRFPNRDNILHNVFSVSGDNRFDLGLYRRGDGKETTFRQPGVVRIFCNVHHSMVAYVVVVATPFYTTAAADGSFRLSGLPAGAGTLTAWNERSEPWETRLVVPAAAPIEVRLEVTKPRVPRHTNKLGLPYARRRSGRSYQ